MQRHPIFLSFLRNVISSFWSTISGSDVLFTFLEESFFPWTSSSEYSGRNTFSEDLWFLWTAKRLNNTVIRYTVSIHKVFLILSYNYHYWNHGWKYGFSEFSSCSTNSEGDNSPSSELGMCFSSDGSLHNQIYISVQNQAEAQNELESVVERPTHII